jgi:hypothetical protein
MTSEGQLDKFRCELIKNLMTNRDNLFKKISKSICNIVSRLTCFKIYVSILPRNIEIFNKMQAQIVFL